MASFWPHQSAPGVDDEVSDAVQSYETSASPTGSLQAGADYNYDANVSWISANQAFLAHQQALILQQQQLGLQVQPQHHQDRQVLAGPDYVAEGLFIPESHTPFPHAAIVAPAISHPSSSILSPVPPTATSSVVSQRDLPSPLSPASRLAQPNQATRHSYFSPTQSPSNTASTIASMSSANTSSLSIAAVRPAPPFQSLQADTGEATSDTSRSTSPSSQDLVRFGTLQPDGLSWRCAWPNCTSQALFSRPCDLRKHYRRHTKSLFCRYADCPQSKEGGFSSNKDRSRHEQKHSPQVKCSFSTCTKTFSRVDNMRDHVRRIHGTNG